MRGLATVMLPLGCGSFVAVLDPTVKKAMRSVPVVVAIAALFLLPACGSPGASAPPASGPAASQTPAASQPATPASSPDPTLSPWPPSGLWLTAAWEREGAGTLTEVRHQVAADGTATQEWTLDSLQATLVVLRVPNTLSDLPSASPEEVQTAISQLAGIPTEAVQSEESAELSEKLSYPVLQVGSQSVDGSTVYYDQVIGTDDWVFYQHFGVAKDAMQAAIENEDAAALALEQWFSSAELTD